MSLDSAGSPRATLTEFKTKPRHVYSLFRPGVSVLLILCGKQDLIIFNIHTRRMGSRLYIFRFRILDQHS